MFLSTGLFQRTCGYYIYLNVRWCWFRSREHFSTLNKQDQGSKAPSTSAFHQLNNELSMYIQYLICISRVIDLHHPYIISKSYLLRPYITSTLSLLNPYLIPTWSLHDLDMLNTLNCQSRKIRTVPQQTIHPTIHPSDICIYRARMELKMCT